MEIINFCFESAALFCFYFGQILGFFVHFLGPSELFLGLGSASKTSFGTYQSRQSTLVLEVQPYLFVYNFPTFGTSFALFGGPSGYFWFF